MCGGGEFECLRRVCLVQIRHKILFSMLVFLVYTFHTLLTVVWDNLLICNSHNKLLYASFKLLLLALVLY